MTKKPEILHELRHVVYDPSQWDRLHRIRDRALQMIGRMEEHGIETMVHGSVARGDVSDSSDIDLVVPYQIPSYRVELAVGPGVRREIVQATPSSVLKGHIHLDERTVVTFPLIKMMSREMDFYRWGGIVDKDQLVRDQRVAGVDKRLILIEPTEDGHVESGVVGYEHIAARKLGVSIEIAQERVRVLLRRDRVGRTGVYLSRVLADDDSFEGTVDSLRDRDPAIRRTIERRSR